MRRIATALLVLGCVAAAAGWWVYRSGRWQAPVRSAAVVERVNWLDHIYSLKPSVAEEAARQLQKEGRSALPRIREALQNPGASEEDKEAALRGCALLGTEAAPAISEVAAHLPMPAYTAEAAVALSFMGKEAFAPLRDALSSEDPIVRRESLRAIGKLHDRAPLDSGEVIPLLLDGLADVDPGVRMVSAVYLGIIHQESEEVVPALMEMLEDEDPEVRRVAAAALGSYGTDAELAVPALRKARGDRDENVAREAGVALVKLNKEP